MNEQNGMVGEKRVNKRNCSLAWFHHIISTNSRHIECAKMISLNHRYLVLTSGGLSRSGTDAK